METSIIETSYPLSFRKDDAKELGEHLKNLHNVVLIGMKRVGINNFLRFFLHNRNIDKTYIKDGKNHLFIFVDLNDLVELEIYPFWTLTFKRIVDGVEVSNLDPKLKKEIEDLFLRNIQFQDLFMIIDGIRRSIVVLVENKVLPTIFFDRFDRIKDVVTPQFYANLQGLRDAAHRKLNYVFTSFRKLDDLAPKVFTKTSISVFVRNIYIKPAKKEDINVVFETFNRYSLKLSENDKKNLFNLVDGYIQYMHLAMIILNEKKEQVGKSLPAGRQGKIDFFNEFVNDERIILQSEELWENLQKDEQSILLKISDNAKITEAEKNKARYLWDMGFVNEEKSKIFSPLFAHFLKQKGKDTGENLEFTKKENLLFIFLKKKLNEICERDEIVNEVWPEVEDLGVSDWAIDRLVARVRTKLKSYKSGYEIQTVKTRGYKLVSS